MPDVTKIQIVAIVQPVITAAVAFGAPITDAQTVALLGLAGAISSALAMADALIRYGRSRALMNVETVKELERLPAPVVNNR